MTQLICPWDTWHRFSPTRVMPPLCKLGKLRKGSPYSVGNGCCRREDIGTDRPSKVSTNTLQEIFSLMYLAVTFQMTPLMF